MFLRLFRESDEGALQTVSESGIRRRDVAKTSFLSLCSFQRSGWGEGALLPNTSTWLVLSLSLSSEMITQLDIFLEDHWKDRRVLVSSLVFILQGSCVEKYFIGYSKLLGEQGPS